MRKNVLTLKVKDLLIIVFNITLMLINLSGALVQIIAALVFEGFFFHERLILFILPILLTASMIIKEFKVKNLVKRVYINLLLFMGFFLIQFYIYLIW
jgi:hypothetical protein